MAEHVTNGDFAGNANGWTMQNGWYWTADHVQKDAATFGAELITNGTFTGSSAGWTLGTATWSPDKVTMVNFQGPVVGTTFSVTSGQEYLANLNQTIHDPHWDAIYFILGHNASIYGQTSNILSNTFAPTGGIGAPFTALATRADEYVSFQGNYGSQTVDADDVSVRAFLTGGSGTKFIYQPISDMVAGNSYTLTFDYTITGAAYGSIGAFVGDAGTYSAIQADQFGNASGTYSQVLTPSSITFVNGGIQFLNYVQFVGSQNSTVTIDNVSLTDYTPPPVVGDLTQNVPLETATYRISYIIPSISGSLSVQVAEDYARTITTAGYYTDTFSHVGAGSYNMGFFPITLSSATVQAASIKKVTQGAVDDNIPIKEFLTGTTDEGVPIFFRADTQTLQIQPSPEMYSTPIALAVEMERGTQTKTFISLDDKPFYELEGTNIKGISILKPHESSDEKIKPPLAQSIQVSLRDSSKQLNRVIQMAVITVPTPIDYSP